MEGLHLVKQDLEQVRAELKRAGYHVEQATTLSPSVAAQMGYPHENSENRFVHAFTIRGSDSTLFSESEYALVEVGDCLIVKRIPLPPV